MKRGLAEKPEDWAWSSFRHYLTGAEGVVEIESEWTAHRRKRMGMRLQVKMVRKPVSFADGMEKSPPKQTRLGWGTRLMVAWATRLFC